MKEGLQASQILEEPPRVDHSNPECKAVASLHRRMPVRMAQRASSSSHEIHSEEPSTRCQLTRTSSANFTSTDSIQRTHLQAAGKHQNTQPAPQFCVSRRQTSSAYHGGCPEFFRPRSGYKNGARCVTWTAFVGALCRSRGSTAASLPS